MNNVCVHKGVYVIFNINTFNKFTHKHNAIYKLFTNYKFLF